MLPPQCVLVLPGPQCDIEQHGKRLHNLNSQKRTNDCRGCSQRRNWRPMSRYWLSSPTFKTRRRKQLATLMTGSRSSLREDWTLSNRSGLVLSSIFSSNPCAMDLSISWWVGLGVDCVESFSVALPPLRRRLLSCCLPRRVFQQMRGKRCWSRLLLLPATATRFTTSGMTKGLGLSPQHERSIIQANRQAVSQSVS